MFANRFGAVPATQIRAPIPVDAARHVHTGDYRPMATHPWHPSEEPPHYSETGFAGFSGGPGFAGPYSKRVPATSKRYSMSGDFSDGGTGPSVPAVSSPSPGMRGFGAFGSFGQASLIDFSSVSNFLNSTLGIPLILAGVVLTALWAEKRGLLGN